MARKLIRMNIDRVDLVDRGANQKANIVLVKRHVTKDSPSIGSVHVDSPAWDADDQDEYEKANLTAEGRRSLPDAAFAAVWTDAQGNKHRKLPIHDAGHLAAARGRIDQANIPADVKARARHKIESAHKEKRMNFRDLIKSILGVSGNPDKVAIMLKALDTPGSPEHEAAEMHHIDALANMHPDQVKAHHAMLSKMVDECGPGPFPDEHPVHALKAMRDQYAKMMDVSMRQHPSQGDDEMTEAEMNKAIQESVAKALSPLQKKLDDAEAEVKKATKRAEDAEIVAKAEHDARADREMADVLKSFKATPFNVDPADGNNDVRKFRKMQEADPEGFKRTMEIIKATDAQLASSALFGRNLGTGRSGAAGSAWEQLEAKAGQIMEKSAGSLSKEKAMERAMDDNPALVKQYRQEQQ